jgi:hypothetical protein
VLSFATSTSLVAKAQNSGDSVESWDWFTTKLWATYARVRVLDAEKVISSLSVIATKSLVNIKLKVFNGTQPDINIVETISSSRMGVSLA